MASSQQHTTEFVPLPKKGKEEKGRGATRMSKVVRARNKGLKFQINWNINDLPIGKHSVPMMSYWGTSIRTNVPITLKTWKSVPQRLLDSLFEDVAVIISLVHFVK